MSHVKTRHFQVTGSHVHIWRQNMVHVFMCNLILHMNFTFWDVTGFVMCLWTKNFNMQKENSVKLNHIFTFYMISCEDCFFMCNIFTLFHIRLAIFIWKLKFERGPKMLFHFFPHSFKSSCFCSSKRSWKLKRPKSTPIEASLSHRNQCSWNASTAVQPLILWLCDITLHHHVTHLHNSFKLTACLAQLLFCC